MKCGQGSGVTELALLFRIALCVGLGQIKFLFWFSAACPRWLCTKYADSADWRFLAGKGISTELLLCCASRFATLEIGRGFYLRQPWGIVR